MQLIKISLFHTVQRLPANVGNSVGQSLKQLCVCVLCLFRNIRDALARWYCSVGISQVCCYSRLMFVSNASCDSWMTYQLAHRLLRPPAVQIIFILLLMCIDTNRHLHLKRWYCSLQLLYLITVTNVFNLVSENKLSSVHNLAKL